MENTPKTGVGDTQKTPNTNAQKPAGASNIVSKITGTISTGPSKPKETIVTKETNFLKWAEKKVDKKEALYSNFFQKDKDGKITVGKQGGKSLLEIVVQIFGFLSPIIAIITIIGFVHVFIRGQESSNFAENFPIICGYLNNGIESTENMDFKCKTISAIQQDYKIKNKEQDRSIVEALSEYIPLKVSENLIDTSPEKNFIVNTFKNKADINAIMQTFKGATEYAQNIKKKHIICTGINIKNGDTLETQCDVYGMKMGETNPVSSARLEALKFAEFLADTNRSQFILTNPPTTLSTEDYESNDVEDEFLGYETRTSLPISVKYIPFSPKN